MLPYSLLDLSPIPQGATPADALRNTVDLAQHAEALGFTRYWLAEHHNSTGIASAATAVVIGQVAAHTSTIRVGAGGIMLPNHSPLVIAEQFGTLATLFPGRIDLGLGRAPGTDQLTARALRRGADRSEQFPNDVVELMGYLRDPEPGQKIVAVPGAGTEVPVWMLGSSLFGAQLAAHLGLPYAFASHFAPDALEDAISVYRASFRPGAIQSPHFMLAVNIFAADTDAEGARIRTSMQQGFINLRKGAAGPLPRPVDDLATVASEPEIRMANHQLRISVVGSKATVKDRLRGLIEILEPDEIILTGHIHDHQARKRSFEIGAEVMRELGAEAGTREAC
ncbi:LLM class flavin-dependent oxidoreductase [Mangrovicoccus sp. HB161399]|uniref:LLM class flavin-dependent oxidoreductase n=1 Tax=Mangrovicoccus sp. HB161399 TaxID=2720392 RepID=UPI0015558ED7|nr:LLM class flavin-dependent oxidoreductase [Mangrovicoccus sp. HB161399]